MLRMNAAMGEFSDYYREQLDARIPTSAESVRTFRARLTAAARPTARQETASRMGRWRFAYSHAAIACAIVAVIAVGVIALDGVGFGLTDAGQMAANVEPDAVPKPSLTPGATSAVLIGDVCDGASKREAKVPTTLSTRVFAEYGIRNPVPGAYEVDYLITPELGGAADLKNLWPEPYFDIQWNARVKDALEVRLHSMVCAGNLDLKTAQRDISTNWIAAYMKYFHSRRPLAGRASATAVQPRADQGVSLRAANATLLKFQ
jgi:hypothetical protein